MRRRRELREAAEQQPLLEKNDAEKLADLLSKFDFGDDLNRRISAKKLLLHARENPLSPEQYFGDEDVVEAMGELKEFNTHWLSAALKTWWEQPHQFSSRELAACYMSMAAIVTALVFVKEVTVLFGEGKPRLQQDGYHMASLCNPLSKENKETVAACVSLQSGQQHQVTLADPNSQTDPSIVNSWFQPIGAFARITCSRQVGNNETFVGEGYYGSLEKAKAVAQSGFVLVNESLPNLPSSMSWMISNVTEALGFYTMMIIGFCKTAQNGGSNGTEYTQGVEEWSDTFERNSLIFAGVYGTIAGVALLTAAYLLLSKGISKWQEAAPARTEHAQARAALSLYQANKPTLAEPPSLPAQRSFNAV